MAYSCQATDHGPLIANVEAKRCRPPDGMGDAPSNPESDGHDKLSETTGAKTTRTRIVSVQRQRPPGNPETLGALPRCSAELGSSADGSNRRRVG